MDDLYDGWSGLDRVAGQLESVLRPLAAGRPGAYRRYDWTAGAYAETVEVGVPGPGGLLVLEGVGSGSRVCADLHTVLVWIEAPVDTRLERGLARDGEALREHWLAWQIAEQAHFERDGTRLRADLVLDGTVQRTPSAPGPGGDRVAPWPQ